MTLPWAGLNEVHQQNKEVNPTSPAMSIHRACCCEPMRRRRGIVAAGGPVRLFFLLLQLAVVMAARLGVGMDGAALAIGGLRRGGAGKHDGDGGLLGGGDAVGRGRRG